MKTNTMHCGICNNHCGVGQACELGKCVGGDVDQGVSTSDGGIAGDGPQDDGHLDVKPPCKERLPIGTSGVFNANLQVVQLSGRVTKNGKTVPVSNQSRGNIVFLNQQGGQRSMPSLGTSGEATYQGEIFAGTYDVMYVPSVYCKEGGALPCQKKLLKKAIVITTSGTLDLDLQTVQLSGRVTKNGKAVPASNADRGQIWFVEQEGQRVMPSLGTSGEATYQGEIFKGTYDVRYVQSAYCKEGGALPCQHKTLKEKVSVSTSGTLDLDLQTVQLSGRVTKNGKAVPASNTDRGQIWFEEEGGQRVMPSLGTSGEATYQGEIFKGTYDVQYVQSAYCKEGGALPCQHKMLKEKVSVNTSGTLDLDLQTVQLSGTVTKNSKAVPDSNADRGKISFAEEKGGQRDMPSFGTSGAATYQGEIFTGLYDVSYHPSAYCKEGGALPCQSKLIRGCYSSSPASNK